MNLPNEGVLWYCAPGSNTYRKRKASLAHDTVLVLEAMSTTSKIFSRSTIEIDVRLATIQIVPAAFTCGGGGGGGGGGKAGANRPQAEAPRVFNKNRARQAYFRLMFKGKMFELKARDNVERDAWVQLLFGLKDRSQTHEETYPFRVPPRDADEHAEALHHERKGAVASPDEAARGGGGGGGADDAPAPRAIIGEVEGVAVVASDDDDDDDDDDDQKDQEKKDDDQKGGLKVSGSSDATAGGGAAGGGWGRLPWQRPGETTIPKKEVEPYELRNQKPSSDRDVAPTIIVDAPSGASTPTLPPTSPRDAHLGWGGVSGAGEGRDGPLLGLPTSSLRPETLAFLARVREMAAFGALRPLPREQRFFDSVFASSVLEEESLPSPVMGVASGHFAGRSLHGGAAAAARDGIAVGLVGLAVGGAATESPVVSRHSSRRSLIREMAATAAASRTTPTPSPHCTHRGTFVVPALGEEVPPREARVAFEDRALVITATEARPPLVIRVPYAHLEALLPDPDPGPLLPATASAPSTLPLPRRSNRAVPTSSPTAVTAVNAAPAAALADVSGVPFVEAAGSESSSSSSRAADIAAAAAGGDDTPCAALSSALRRLAEDRAGGAKWANPNDAGVAAGAAAGESMRNGVDNDGRAGRGATVAASGSKHRLQPHIATLLRGASARGETDGNDEKDKSAPDDKHGGDGDGAHKYDGRHAPLSAASDSTPTVATAQKGAARVLWQPRLELQFWASPATREGPAAVAATLFPSPAALRRVILTFSDPLDLRVCVHLLVTKQRDAIAGLRKELALAQTSGGGGARADRGEAAMTATTAPLCSRSTASSAVDVDTERRGAAGGDFWWLLPHRVGAERSLLLRPSAMNARELAGALAAARVATTEEKEGEDEGEEMRRGNGSAAGGVDPGRCGEGERFVPASCGAATASATSSETEVMGSSQEDFRDLHRKLLATQRAHTQSLREKALHHAHLDALCHRSVQRFIAASKGFY